MQVGSVEEPGREPASTGWEVPSGVEHAIVAIFANHSPLGTHGRLVNRLLSLKMSNQRFRSGTRGRVAGQGGPGPGVRVELVA